MQCIQRIERNKRITRIDAAYVLVCCSLRQLRPLRCVLFLRHLSALRRIETVGF